MSWFNKTALIIASIGAINWGLATFGHDIVDRTIGELIPELTKIIYWIIAISGIYVLILTVKNLTD